MSTDENPYNAIKNTAKLFKQKTLLDIALEIEKFFDFMNLYVYPNWLSGEIVYGPSVKRYWVEMVLQYDYEQMPDPMGARILHDIGAKIEFKKSHIKKPRDVKSREDMQVNARKPLIDTVPVWHVVCKIPRRFIDNIDYNELDEFEDDVDLEDIEKAGDQGLDVDTTAQQTPTPQEPLDSPGENDEQTAN